MVERLAVAFGELTEIEQLEIITRKLIKVLRPEVHFVHVMDGKETNQKYTGGMVEKTFSPGFPTSRFFYDTLPPGPVARRLLDYARSEKIGLLVLGHQKRGYWESLFSNSRAKPIIRHCEVPLLVIPITK